MSLRLLLSQNTSLTAEAAGPGPQAVVAGDGNLGYYGEVPDTKVLTVTDLLSQIPELNFGTLAGTSITWLKFSYQGKIYYIPKQPVIRQMSWNQLYNAGLIYGTDDFGLANTGYQANQLRIVKSGSYTFKVRTITNDVVDPSTILGGGSSGYDTGVHPSMWTDLLYRVCSRVIGSYPTAKWANNADTDLTASTTSEITREAASGYLNYCITRSGSRIDYYGLVLKTGTSSTSWRPVLELITRDVLAALTGIVAGVVDAPVAPSSLTIPAAQVDPTKPLVSLSNIVPLPTGFQTPPGAASASVVGFTGLNNFTLFNDGAYAPSLLTASAA